MASFVKINRPRLVDIYRRERLFEQLDMAFNTRPVVWLSGPPGAGKTTLAASYLDVRQLNGLWYQVDEGDQDLSTFFYFLGLAARDSAPLKSPDLPLLTPEYLLGIPGFTRNFFRTMFSALSRPAVVVLDNYQEVPAEGAFQDMIRVALSEIPDGCNLLILSRQAPPRQLAQLEANDRLAVIGWQELRLQDEEAAGIITLRRPTDNQAERLSKLIDKAHGWAAGLVLLLEWFKTESVEPEGLDASIPETLFNYFTTEVLQSLAPHAERFIFQTALLPTMTASMAAALTGEAQAEAILAELAQRNNFLTRHFGQQTIYQYHPLFREFLLTQAPAVLGEETWRSLRRRAAEVLEQDGEAETSLRYWKGLDDWASVARALSSAAPALLEKGRNQTVLSLLQGIPPDVTEHWPELHYWRGMSLLHLDPGAALQAFKTAYAQSKISGDVDLLYSAWCGVVESYWFLRHEVHSLNDWLDEFHALQKAHPLADVPALEARTAVSVYCAMVLSRLDDPGILDWERRVLALVQGGLPQTQRLMASTILMRCNTWFGSDRQTATVVLGTVGGFWRVKEVSPLDEILALYCTSMYHCCFTGSIEAFTAATDQALAKAAEHGIHVLDKLLKAWKIYVCLTEERLAETKELWRCLPEVWDSQRKYELYLYNFLLSNEKWLSGQFQQALEIADIAYQAAIDCGEQSACIYVHTCLAQIYASQGVYREAFRHLAVARRRAKQCRIHIIECVGWLADALYALECGQPVRCRHFLRRALAIGRETGYLRFPLFKRSDLARLCAVALEAGIETDYARTLVRERQLVPGEPLYRAEQWPWPLRIRCFGRFEILKDDAPLTFSRKAPKKPLDLLKALIAFGGRSVPQSRLQDTLWPDQEADAAEQSFHMALLRLRKLIGGESLILHEGRLSLEPARGWVDVWAFEERLQQAKEVGRHTQAEHCQVRLEKALTLYRGSFLLAEEASWSITLRERLREGFIHALTELGRHLEQHAQWSQCLAWYQRGLEVEAGAEGFYQGLMRSYHRLGRPAEALAAYQRCRRVLAIRLGAKPSAATEHLARQIAQG